MANSMYATECTCRGFELCEFCVLECVRHENKQAAARHRNDAAAAPSIPLGSQIRADLDTVWA